jgi:hypothetical protein
MTAAMSALDKILPACEAFGRSLEQAYDQGAGFAEHASLLTQAQHLKMQAMETAIGIPDGTDRYLLLGVCDEAVEIEKLLRQRLLTWHLTMGDAF